MIDVESEGGIDTAFGKTTILLAAGAPVLRGRWHMYVRLQKFLNTSIPEVVII